MLSKSMNTAIFNRVSAKILSSLSFPALSPSVNYHPPGDESEALRASFRVDVVGVDGVLIAQEELTAGNDRVAPRRQVARPELESAMLTIPLGCGLGEPDDTVLAVEIQPVVRDHERSLAHAPVLPRNLAGIELHSFEDHVVEAIEVVADEHRGRVMVLHLAREVHLARVDPSTRGSQFEEHTARAVSR